jgi:LacI family transcriptional regulator
MVTRKDVAERAGVSTATVSYVINNGPRPTSPETRAKVLKAIQELSYKPNFIARSLKTKSSKVIGLVIPDSSNAFFSEVARGIEDTAYAWGYTVMFGNTGGEMERQAAYIDTLISQMVDGMIFITTPMLDEQLKLLQQYDVPIIVIDPECEIQECRAKLSAIISVDGRKGGKLAGVHLIERGHTKMAVIAGALEVPPATVRVEGFLEASSLGGVEADVVWAGDHPSDGYRAAKSLLQTKNPPTAIFACNDLLALGVLRAAADIGIPIPLELAVVGFDDIDIANFVVPRLTTIRQPKYQMGKIAAEKLFQVIQSSSREGMGVEEETDTDRILLDTELIIREST